MKTVLVVESEALTRHYWTEALRNRGYRVLEAWESSEALRLARSERIDVLLLEVFFSDSGAAKRLACRMKHLNPRLRVILASTLRLGDLPADLPYDATLGKPATTQQLLTVLGHLVRN